MHRHVGGMIKLIEGLHMQRHVILLVGVLAAAGLTGCTTPLTDPLNPTERDTSGQFDGNWEGKAWLTKTPQVTPTSLNDRAISNCAPFTDDLKLSVIKGWADGSFKANEPVTFRVPVDSEGRFYASVPVQGSLGVSRHLPIYDYQKRVIISGILDPKTSMAHGSIRTAPMNDKAGCEGDFAMAKDGTITGYPDLPPYSGDSAMSPY
ncbi:hypothetical protein C4K68_26615 [Pokkaliibacter plantistimulans]|uniref:Uncharacterized protein n=1 Tax=Proteobacteria bacterium 228 TaxID=2083153 RepID=A0A2S5KIP7_9PROT|nr:hypothetical protein [Pokkaliibacter plantistimulans]PPC74236.1 hypothetical protein C4K68_26615 [Pokkaliibacter plantistimulans]